MKSTQITGWGLSCLIAVLGVFASLLLRIWQIDPRAGGQGFIFFPFFPYWFTALLCGFYFGWRTGILIVLITCPVVFYRNSGFIVGLGWLTYVVFLATSAGIFRMQQVLLNARDRERERRLAQSNFVTMLAHEIKTPLAAIQLAAGSLARGLDVNAAAMRLHNLNCAVEDITAVVDRCLEADRVEQTDLKIEVSSFALNDCLTDIVASSRNPERIDLSCQGSPTIATDALLLRRVMTNLIDNGLKYSPPGSRIAVSAAPQKYNGKRGIVLKFNNSIGSTGAPDRNKVFEKYYRAPSAHAVSGAGLGLWLVRRIVAQLSGRIDYQLGNGCVTFTVRLPLSP